MDRAYQISRMHLSPKKVFARDPCSNVYSTEPQVKV